MLKNKKSAEIGQLILFIAILIVSAVVAGFFIESTNSFTNKANDISKDTTNKLLNSFDIVQVISLNSSNSTLPKDSLIEMTAKSSIGSSDISLENFIIIIETENFIQTLTHSENSSYTTFSVKYLLNSNTPKKEGHILENELVKVEIKLQKQIKENEDVRISYGSSNSKISAIKFKTPNSIFKKINLLYP